MQKGNKRLKSDDDHNCKEASHSNLNQSHAAKSSMQTSHSDERYSSQNFQYENEANKSSMDEIDHDGFEHCEQSESGSERENEISENESTIEQIGSEDGENSQSGQDCDQ